MNKVNKDYCSRNHHPNWKAWTAQYETDRVPPYKMNLVGLFCNFCGNSVDKNSAYGYGPPSRINESRSAILQGEIPSDSMRWPEIASKKS